MAEPTQGDLEHAAQGLLAGEQDDGPALHDVERCPTCNRPMDDIETMNEAALLDALQTQLLRDLLRGFVQGTITHQEKAILRGLLRDNRKTVLTELDQALTSIAAARAGRRTELPTQSEFDETSGG